jgi:hypothetical protein
MDYVKLLKVVCYFDDFYSFEGINESVSAMDDNWLSNPMVTNGVGNCPEVIFFSR